MFNFILNKTSTKFKIIYLKIIFITIALSFFSLENILKLWFNISFILFIFIGIFISLIFINENSIIYDKKRNKIIKKTDIISISIIISIIFFRLVIIENLLINFWILNIELAIYLISLWFFLWKIFFAIKKIFLLKNKHYV